VALECSWPVVSIKLMADSLEKRDAALRAQNWWPTQRLKYGSNV
jgi:hypothetical protein